MDIDDYFKYISGRVTDDTHYLVLQPYGYPLILKDKSGIVLASLQVFFDDEPIEKQNYPIPVPYDGGFQIIFQSDDAINDKGRPIKYVITNLCDNFKYIKFDIGYGTVPSCVTDPPENINRVNELFPFQSFSIKSNQQDSWKNLIVKTKKKNNSDGSISSVALKDEVVAEDKVGTYLYLTVTPSNNFDSQLFYEPYWCTEDTIIVENRLFKKYYEEPHQHLMLADRHVGNSIRGAGRYDDFDDDIGGAGRYDDFDDDIGGADIYKGSFELGMNSTNNTESIIFDKSFNIGDSKVAEMSGGDNVIVQTGNQTLAEYDYTRRTQPSKIGLCVMDLAITKTYKTFTDEELKNMIDSYIESTQKIKNNKFVEIAKSIKKYKSDICTVCLEPDSPPNTVLVRCGHVCTCSSDCTKILNGKCPICRADILCEINERLLLVDS
jgi:hypothetical protein